MKNKEKKKEKEFWRREFRIAPGRIAFIDPEVERLNFRHSELDDDGIYWITTRLKIIHQLDLDETYVTDKAIQYLTKLDYIKELRLKGCDGISPGCLADLNKLTGLELLHLGSTGITLDDVHALFSLQKLQLLLLRSSQTEEVIVEKVRQLKKILPSCKFNVNYKIYA